MTLILTASLPARPTRRVRDLDAVTLAHEKGRTVVTLRGGPDRKTLMRLSATLVEALRDRGRDVVVDLGQVGSIDMAVVGVLVRTRHALRHQGRRLTLRDPSVSVARMLDHCHLTGLVEPAAGRG